MHVEKEDILSEEAHLALSARIANQQETTACP